jgi:hypothetical protein
MQPGLAGGRIVQVWFREGGGAGMVPRPAMVVHVHQDEAIDCHVHLDSDRDSVLEGVSSADLERLIIECLHVPFSATAAPGCWTWPARSAS